MSKSHSQWLMSVLVSSGPVRNCNSEGLKEKKEKKTRNNGQQERPYLHPTDRSLQVGSDLTVAAELMSDECLWEGEAA